MASHLYLGINERGIRSRNQLLHEGDVVDMVLLPLRSVVLFPNESVPLRIRNHSYIAAIEEMLRGEGERTSTRTNGTTDAMNHSSTCVPTPTHLGIVNLSDSDTAITIGFVGTMTTTPSHY